MPSTRAKSLPRPQGMIATRAVGSLERGRRAGAAGRRRRARRRSRPSAAAVGASSSAWSMLRVVTVRWAAPRRSSSAWHGGQRLRARAPPAEAGFTSSAKRRLTRRPPRAPRRSPGGRRGLRALRRGSAALRPSQVRLRSTSDVRPRHELVAEQPLGVRLLEVVGSSVSSTSCWTLCQGSSVTLLGGHQQLPGPRQPVQLEDAQPVGVEPLAVREQEVQAARTASTRRHARIARRSDPRPGRGVEVAHQEVEELLGVGVAARAARRPARAAAGSGGPCRCGRRCSCRGRTGGCSRARGRPSSLGARAR